MALLPVNFLPHTGPIPESLKKQLRRLAAEAEAYKFLIGALQKSGLSSVNNSFLRLNHVLPKSPGGCAGSLLSSEKKSKSAKPGVNKHNMTER